jgi:hypothetical protein
VGIKELHSFFCIKAGRICSGLEAYLEVFLFVDFGLGYINTGRL